MSKRIYWIDILRGIGIISIVFSHVLQDEGLISKYLYSFHVPLFFGITGMLYKTHKENLRDYLFKKTRKILIPYLIWSVVSMILYIFLGQFADSILKSGRRISISNELLELCRGYSNGNSPLWFLPAVYFTSITMFLVCKFVNGFSDKYHQRVISIVVIAIQICSAYLVVSSGNNYAIWSLDDVIILFLFVWVGYLFRNRIEKISISIGTVCICVAIAIALGVNGRISYLVGRYHSLVWFYLSAMLSIVGLSSVARAIGRWRLIEYVGRNTMPILLMHKFPVLFFQCVCPIVKDRWAERSLPYMILITVVSIMCCCCCGELFRKYMPVVIGEKRD